MEWPDLAPGTIHRSLFAAACRPCLLLENHSQDLAVIKGHDRLQQV